MAITVGQLLVRLGMDLTDFTKGLQDAQKELRTQGDAFKNAGEFMSKAFTLPLAGIATASAMAFAGFEQSMNKVLALGGKDVADMFGDLQKQALQLGADTKYSAKQAADAMGELAAAGFKGNEIMKAMPGLLSLAATENMKLADAARIASSVLKGFGIDASRMGDVADILAKTAAMSAVSIQDLGYSFQYIGPAARAAGQSFMDISAALAVLGNAGIRGESAGTALRNMLNDLMTPTKAVAGALEALKIKTTDVYGKLLPMGDLIKNLTPLTNNMALGFKLFGQRFSDIIPLIADGGEAFRAAQKEIKEFTGAADAMAKTMQKGIAGNLEKFTGNLETVAISIGKVLAPAVNLLIGYGSKVLDWVQNLVDAFGKLPVGVQSAVIAFAALVAAIGPALYILGSFAGAIGELKLLSPALGLAGKAFTYLGLDISGTTSKIADFVRSLASMTVSSAGASLTSFFTNFGKTIKDTFGAIPGQLSAAKASLLQFGSTLASAVVSNAKAAWTAIAGFTAELLKMAQALRSIDVSKSLGAISDSVSAFSKGIAAKGMAGLWDDMILGAGKLSGLLKGGFTAALAGAGEAMAGLGSAAVVGAAAFTAIAAAATAAAVIIHRDWDDIGGVFSGIAKDIDEDASGLKQTLVGLWASMAGGPLLGAVISSWRFVGGFFKDMWNGIVLVWNTGMQTLANTLADWLTSISKFKIGSLDIGGLLHFENTIKGLRDYGTEVGLLEARLKKVQSIALPGASGEALASVEKLNALVAKYSSEVRIGKISWAEAKPQINSVMDSVKDLYKQYAQVQRDFKMGLISPEAFEKSKAAIKQSIDSAVAFSASMGANFGAAGIDVSQFGKTAKTALTDFEKHMKAAEKSGDAVRDMVEDLPKTWEKFTAAMDNNKFNPGKVVDQLNEKMRDIGRVIEKEVNPKVRAALLEQIKQLDAAAAGVIWYKQQWEQNKIVAEAEKISKAFEDIVLAQAKLDLAKSFKSDVWKQNNDIVEQMEQHFKDVDAAARLLGVTLDETAIKSKGQFSNVVLNANDAIKAYNLLANTAGVTSAQMLAAWVGMEKRKLEATQAAFETMTIQNNGFMETMRAAWRIGIQEFGIAIVEGMKKSQAMMNEAGRDLFTSLFSFNGGKIMEGITTFGQKALGALKAAFIEPFEKLFGSIIGNMSMQVTKFVTDKIMGLLGKAFGDIFTKAGLAIGSTAPLQAAAVALQTAATSLHSAAASLAATNGGLKVASEAAGAASKTASESASRVAGSASQVATTASTTLGKVSQISGIITGAISAVTGVLSYLQGRRMEQDIGRIEVSNRGILNEVMNLRADEWKRESHLFKLDSMADSVNRFGDAHGAYLSEILGTLQTISETLLSGVTFNGSGDGSGSGFGRGSGIPTDVEANATSVADNLQQLAEQAIVAQYYLDEMAKGSASAGASAVNASNGLSDVVTSTSGLTAAQTEATETTKKNAEEIAKAGSDLIGKFGEASEEYRKWKLSLISEETKAYNKEMEARARANSEGIAQMDRWGNELDKYGNVVRYSAATLASFSQSVTGTTSELNGAFQRLVGSAVLGSEQIAEAAAALAREQATWSGGVNSGGTTRTDGAVLGGGTAIAPAAPVNSGAFDWNSGSAITIGGRTLPQQFLSAAPITLNVTVNNADARTVANEMVTQWRTQGVDI